MNQTEFHNQKKNCHYDRIPFNLNGIWKDIPECVLTYIYMNYLLFIILPFLILKIVKYRAVPINHAPPLMVERQRWWVRGWLINRDNQPRWSTMIINHDDQPSTIDGLNSANIDCCQPGSVDIVPFSRTFCPHHLYT